MEPVDELEAIATAVLSLLRYPDNGAHHCRTCKAGSANQWQHDDYCTINSRCLEIEKLRERIRAYFAAKEEKNG